MGWLFVQGVITIYILHASVSGGKGWINRTATVPFIDIPSHIQVGFIIYYLSILGI